MKFLNSFKRIISHGNYVPEIDGLRFIAILPVVLMHANTNYLRQFGDDNHIAADSINQVLSFGGTGVWVFFAISGFVLSNIFAKHFIVRNQKFNQLDLKSYFIRRLTRLEPPFIISTVLLFFLTSIVIVGNFKDLLPNLGASLLYCHQFIFGEWSPINPVTWSLEVEVQFYIIAPFLCWLIFTQKSLVRLIIILLLIIIIPILVFNQNSIFVNNSHFSKSLPVYFHYFLVGILLADLYNSPLWLRIKSKSYFWDIIGLISLVILYSTKTNYNLIMNYYIIDLTIFLVLISAFKGNLLNKFFSNSLIATIGGMCYSIYLIHYPILFASMKFLGKVRLENSSLNYIWQMLIGVGIVTVASFLFFKFFERPFMDKHWPEKLKNKLFRTLPK